jgi:hypothetical protein
MFLVYYGIILRYIMSKESKLLEFNLFFWQSWTCHHQKPPKTSRFSIAWFNSTTTLSKILLSSCSQSPNCYEKQRFLIGHQNAKCGLGWSLPLLNPETEGFAFSQTNNNKNKRKTHQVKYKNKDLNFKTKPNTTKNQVKSY